MKKCKNCGEKFEPRFNTLEAFCWAPECKTIEALKKLDKLKAKNAKIQRQNDIAKRKKIIESLKTASQWKNELQVIFNRWIRLRDRGKNCVSCLRPLGDRFDAGHYYAVGNYPGLRFDPLNVHGQCVECNKYNGGNLHEYRENLFNRIGPENVEYLDQNRNKLKKISIPEIQELIRFYKDQIKKIEKS